MNQTKKLYDDMPYETEFEAEVISVESAENQIKVVLNQTLFFPEEGGQNPDSGTLNKCSVTDVQIQNGIITHIISTSEQDEKTSGIRKGERVFGKIDWARRFSNMQNHSGEHIISGILFRRYSSNNVGFHLNDHLMTLDTSRNLTLNEMVEVEEEANEVIYRNLPVRTFYPDSETLKSLEYRSKGEIEGPVRLVDIEGVDLCACCAPHVARTGEIGLIKIVHAIRYKSGTRLTILCGRRAFAYLQELHDQTQTLSRLLSEPPEKVGAAVERLYAETGNLRAGLSELQQRLVLQEIRGIPDTREHVWLFFETLDVHVQRNAVNLLVEKHAGYCGIFSGNDKDGYRYIIGGEGRDTRAISTLLKAEFGAKGGGKPEMVQGSVEAPEKEILAVLNRSVP